jgi:membrane fusion protein (multidrug efflux system)
MSATGLNRVAVEAKPAPRIRISLQTTLLIAGAALILVGAAGFGYRWWTLGRFFLSTDDAYVGGNVTALAPHVAGFVSKIAVGDNQFVRRGQVLVRLDDCDFRAAEDHASAVVEQKRAAVADLEAKLALQNSIIREAAADVAAKGAAAAFARDDDGRYQGLFRAVAISRQDVQRASSADAQAQSALAAARAGLVAANQQLAVIQSDIAAARADIAQSEADLRTAQLNQNYTIIRSPIEGYLGNRAIRVGAYVTVGSYLLSIIPAHGLWVDANFKEDQLARIRAGQSAAVVADVIPGRTFRGHVASLAPGTGSTFSVIPPENATGNFTKIVQRVPVRIELDSADATLGELRPGLSITATVDTRTAP